jgi:pimeloyl-ACP methyl ester carboxylesterase
MMSKTQHRTVETNGIRMHIAEQGDGPLVILCHGFPESWYAWRHQLSALALAGFRAVAPDMRGYGRTDAPQAIDQYTLLHLVGDMVGLLDALGAETAIIAGHDWGAPVAWHAALLRPDRFQGAIGLSVPFLPRGQVYPSRTPPQTDDLIFYQQYFQEPGVAEADFERDVRFSVRSILYGISGNVMSPEILRTAGDNVAMVSRKAGFNEGRTNPASLPAWVTEADVDFLAGEFTRSGFRGGLNWYRNIDRNWQLLSGFAGAKLTVPALYIVGDSDLVLAFNGMDRVVSSLSESAPKLRRTLVLPECGHWTQQEQPTEVSDAIIDFARSL